VSPTEQLAAVLARIPYVAHLGARAELHGDEMTAVLPYSPHLIGNPMLPALHGGVIGGFMELTAVIQLSIQSGPGMDSAGPKPIDVTVEYLRSGRPRDTFARAEVKKVGRRIANVQVEAWQEARAKPIAALRGHFLLGG
jgi:uncharacterized protein (TIGR00369 family)